MLTRRTLLHALSLPAGAGLLASCRGPRAHEALAQFSSAPGESPESVAADEERWASLRDAFDGEPEVLNLNNGGCCPAPRVVQDEFKRLLDFANALPTRHLWQVQAPLREHSRRGLAALWGCDPEEIALTRNASESLQTCLFGVDLERGDEVLTSDQDYPRMITTLEQRARREGIVVRKVELPAACDDDARIVERFEAAIGPRTRLVLACQVINLTARVLPIRDLARLTRARGIAFVVDGAHGFAHLEAQRDELELDYYGTSLHKWLLAPHGAGMLYVRSERIGALWPLMAATDSKREDIRKFEEVGTAPLAQSLAVATALDFHHAIGGANKLARLRYLRDCWALRLSAFSDRVRLNTNLAPGRAAGFGNLRIEGLDTAALCAHLWGEHGILTTAILPPFPDSTHGLRITPNVYTSLADIERFCAAVERAIVRGIAS